MHANNAEAALSRLAACAMQASDALPWAVVCRGIVDGFEAVVHQTRTLEGTRRVDQMVRVRDYDAAENRWIVDPTWPPPAPETARSPATTPARSASRRRGRMRGR